LSYYFSFIVSYFLNTFNTKKDFKKMINAIPIKILMYITKTKNIEDNTIRTKIPTLIPTSTKLVKLLRNDNFIELVKIVLKLS